MKGTRLNRRDFLKVMGTASANLVIGIYLSGCSEPEIVGASATPTDEPRPTELPQGTLEPNIYLKIDSDGTVTVTAFRSEMGQGIRTAIAMILADELDASWDSVRIEQAHADPIYGDQVTGGSASISSYYGTLRGAGAVAREMLKSAAAGQWEVNAEDCRTASGFVIHPDGQQQLSYGELAGSASEVEPPEIWSVPLKPESEFQIIGSGVDHWDAPDIVTGAAQYGSDIKLPGMLYATIARCPVFGGSVASYDDTETLLVQGVHSVHELDGDVAVVAENTWAAIKGRQALQITWDEGDGATLSSQSIRDGLAESAPEVGSAGDGRIDAVYEFPYQAHVTMEPMNCVADMRADSCEVWAPTQNPQQVKTRVQRVVRLPDEKITIHVPLLGGGFGRRLEADYAVEAARVSQAVGAPVKVFWTREDDMQHDYYHPLSYQYASGDPGAVTRPSVRAYDGEYIIPTGAWRSVFNHPQAYVRECFIDEMAIAAGRDPLDYRLEIFSGRGRAVIELVGEKSDWGEPLPENWGRGLAYFATFNVTHVAMVAEVEVKEGGQVRVHRVVCAVDCGVAVNPDNVAAQIEGGIAFGLTAALKAGVTLEDGRILESNFHDCPILQIDEMPVVEVHIIESSDNPSGMGEMGVPTVAPAVANAIFDAIGIRVRHLPIKTDDLI